MSYFPKFLKSKRVVGPGLEEQVIAEGGCYQGPDMQAIAEHALRSLRIASPYVAQQRSGPPTVSICTSPISRARGER